MDIPFSNVNGGSLDGGSTRWYQGLPVPKFLEMKSVLGIANPPADIPGWGGTSCVNFFLFFIPLLVVEPVLLASGSSLMWLQSGWPWTLWSCMLFCRGVVWVSPVKVDLLGDSGGIVCVPPVCEIFLGEVCVDPVIPVCAGSLDGLWVSIPLGWSVPVVFPLKTVIWLKFCESSNNPAAKLSVLVGHGDMNLPNCSAPPWPATDISASYDLDLVCSSHLGTWVTWNVLLITSFLFFLGVDVGAVSWVLLFGVWNVSPSNVIGLILLNPCSPYHLVHQI